MTETSPQHAWVPFDSSEGWDVTAEVAVAWVLQEAKRLRAEPLLMSVQQDGWDMGPDVIGEFTRTYPASTILGKRLSHGRGPVLVYAPNYKLMEVVSTCYKNAPLVVVEYPDTPLIGWAVEVRARNLLTGEIVPEMRSKSQIEAIDDIHFNGHNGWHGNSDKERVIRSLKAMVEQGEMDRNLILGCMIARGHSSAAIEGLAKIIDQVSRRARPS